MENKHLETAAENFTETTSYDSIKGLTEFIRKEKQPTNYATITSPETKIFALGESHLDSTTKAEVEDCIAQLKEQGFTHLGLEFFGAEMQSIIENYARTKNEKDKETLLKHLKTYSEKDAELYLSVVEKAISLGIKVIGLDMPQKEKNYHEQSQEIELLQKRNSFMAQRIETILSENEEYKMLIFCGSGHIENEDDGTGSIVVDLRSRGIGTISVLLSGRLKRPYYQGPDIGEVVQHMGLETEKFMLPAQKKFPNARIPFDWIIHIPELPNRDNVAKPKI